MCETDEFLNSHTCGWGEATLVEQQPTALARAADGRMTRRKALSGLGGATAMALLSACAAGQDAGTPRITRAPRPRPTPTPTGQPTGPGSNLGAVMDGIDEIQVWQEEFYKDLHRHPDVWGEEARTAAKITAKLKEIGVEETLQIGGGVVGIIRNGDGGKLLFRADMDALPVTEATNLEYKSVENGKMHACGHDAHVASALAAAALLARNRSGWSGTYLALFQPGEETGKGARAMVDDGLVTKLAAHKPEVCLAQHVLTVPEAGHVATRVGPVLSAGDSIKVTVFGKGSHGSMPHLGVDPAVLASAIVMRLQGIVSRELAPGEFGVVTVGSMKVGNAPNVISDRAELQLNVRAYDMKVRDKILKAIDRIVRGECAASGSPTDPVFETIATFPLTVTDKAVTEAVTAAFTSAFGADRVHELAPVPASEDFSIIPDAFKVPYTYWGNGGFQPGMPVVGNHNPTFAPAIQPTLRTGTEAIIAASLVYLGKK